MMHFDTEDLHDIAAAVWDSLARELEPSSACADELLTRSGSVDIRGAWTGRIVLDASDSALRAMAAAMFAVPDDEVAEDQLTDALAELTNMVGGNIKCLLEEESKLSLPKVPADLDGSADQQAFFADPNGPVRIRVFGGG